ncbi:MATE family efflux transporter [Intestinimonas massiliensis (ex Afouda et al. 2020)]|uniref:MATE family efflux transporter n=1 Tax=Intestinimonas massiliensis (ex Afouda et al. 2020) TaxID=1673721 RepID=UPI001030C5C2|nr:MATE family efflux transporter [Intestinimonas massiliensis (ex Afouda et al. 2020)]
MFSYLNRGRAFYKDVVLLALPILLQNLCTTLLGLVDTFMVGALGEAPLAAVLVANNPVFVIQLVIFGLQSGSSVLISQFWGKGDTDSINRVVGLGCYVAGAVAALFAAVMCFFPTQLMGMLTDNQALVPVAASYARIVGPSYLFNSITGVYVGAHRSMENPKLGMAVFAISMSTNTFLNWILIFGNLGAPALGVEGAALATLLSRILEFLIMGTYALTNRRFRLKPALLARPGAPLVRKFFRYSGPVVLNETLWGLGTALHKVVMGHMENSTEILAARAVAGNIEDLSTVAIIAVGGTTAIVVGREIGAGRREHIYEIGATLNTLAMACGLVIGIPLICCAHLIFPWSVYPFFHLSPMAGEIATMMLTFIGAVLPLRAFNTVNTVGVLRGGGDVRAATIIDLLPLWLVALPLSALFGLALKWGIFWVYLGVVMEMITKFFIGVPRFRSRAWINDVTQFSHETEKEVSP